MRRAFDRMSDRTRYLRFFSPTPSLSEGTLDYLTQVDHHDHEALVALDEDGEIVGVARYVRLEDGVAEPAITVIDEWQNRGLSGVLMPRLVHRAIEEGYTEFLAWALAENPRGIGVIRALGDTESKVEGNTIELRVPLSEPDIATDRMRDIVRDAAESALAAPVTAWRRLGSVLRVGIEGRTEPWEGAGELGAAIVVGVDARGTCSSTMRTALTLAETLDAPLHVVAAYRPLSDSRTHADDLLREISGQLASVPVEAQVHLRLGDAAEALVGMAEATNAHTIVVGAGERGRRAFPGGLADKVARHAPCNVLVARAVPGDGASDD